ncbi:hypothetical protein [Streptomyces orinoci]|uniref:hypothetical protein n=1 Tax=Streptomyces orinoci TaxID=67339 RepID=UPI00137A6F88|nr:hypothetical protein [Streptomyces orinoci]
MGPIAEAATTRGDQHPGLGVRGVPQPQRAAPAVQQGTAGQAATAPPSRMMPWRWPT